MRFPKTYILGTRVVVMVLGAGLVHQMAPTTVSAQENRTVRFQRLMVEHGLPQEASHAILQDRVGLMWFGTQEGLVRWDGYQFTVFDHDPNDRASLSNDWVWSLVQDRDGLIWIGTDGGGLNRFDPSTETFAHFRFDASNPESLSNDRVRVIYADRSGVLWVGTDGGGLNKFDSARGTFRRIDHDPANPNSLGGDRVRGISEDADGAIWVATDGGGLSKLDSETLLATRYRHDPTDPSSLGSDRIRVISRTSDGALWVGTYESGLDRFDRATGQFVHYRHAADDSDSLSDNGIRDIYEDSTGVLWVATGGGLSEWRPKRQTFVRHLHSPQESTSLSDDRVNVLYEDQGSVLWVGTSDGLNRFNIATGTFRHFSHDPNQPNRLSHNVVTAFAEGLDGRIWVGTHGGGLNRFDRAAEAFAHYGHDDANPATLSDDRVTALAVARSGALWIGTFDSGLNEFNPESGRFTRYRHDPDDPMSLSSDDVTSIVEDHTGLLWVGTARGGLNRFEPATGLFAHYRHDPSDPASLSTDSVLALYEDRSGALWIGTDGGGLNRFERGAGTFVQYRHDPDDPSSLSSDSAWAITEDHRGGLWISTEGGGLNHWSGEDRRAFRNRFSKVLRSDGLPSSVVYGVLEDGQGHLWGSTNRGLTRFDPLTREFKTYTATHGLQGPAFSFGAFMQTGDGEMYFGGSNGFNVFEPSQLRDNQHVPPVVLTGIYKFDKRVELETPLTKVSEIELSSEDPVVTFEFAALDFTAPERNRHQYRLDGFDDEWHDATQGRRATYTNLDPGEYTLRVRAANNDGLWNDDGLSVRLLVTPPWWKTTWATAVYFLMVIGLGMALQWRHKTLLERETDHGRRLESEVEARAQELTNRNEELANLNEKLQQVSYTDPLTGLWNRRYFLSQIKEDIALVKRTYIRDDGEGSGKPNRDLLFLMMDLDGMKEANDTYGHAAGDRMLLTVREILGRVCRQSDTLIRWGGDEFLLVGRHTDRVVAEHIAERIRSAVNSHEFELSDGITGRLSCSIGFAVYPFIPNDPDSLSWEQVLHMADRGLYISKQAGRNNWTGVSSSPTVSPLRLVERIDDPLDLLVKDGLIVLHPVRDDFAHAAAETSAGATA